MEHELLQLLHLPPQEGQEHLTVSAGFFDVHGDVHFQGSGCGGGFVGTVAVPSGLEVDDDCSWVEDLMQLRDELFGGASPCDDNAGGTDESDQQPWQWHCYGGGSADDPPPSMSCLDGGDGSPPSVEQGAGDGELASEPPHREDADDASQGTRKRRDRSKTIVSERKRTVRMKEKLYELRSLVPNITKMDKASIIADAVGYVNNLQARARKLKEEVSALEARPRSPRQDEQQQQHNRRDGRRRQERDDDNAGSTGASGARLTHVDAVQVGEGRFFVTVECERRDGVAAPLCAAVESLACFRVDSSSLVPSGPDRVVSTLTLKVNEQAGDAAVCEGSVVKLLAMAALLKEGFRPEAAVEIS